MKNLLSIFFLLPFIYACTYQQNPIPEFDWTVQQDSTQALFSISEGLIGPEAVRYDKELDVFFIANFNGSASQDSNGFISKASFDGSMIDSRFMTGTEQYPLHGPRGMFIIENELFAADADGIHIFDKNTGEQLRFIDFTSLSPGFLNDVSANSDGTVYVTDTGKPVVYRIVDNTAEVFIDSLPVYPNGVTLNPVDGSFVMGSWRRDTLIYSFNDQASVSLYADLEGGNYDGLEYIGEDLIITSQVDSTLRHYLPVAGDRVIIHTPGRPADIGMDTQRYRVAVPYIAKDRVDVWQLPVKE